MESKGFLKLLSNLEKEHHYSETYQCKINQRECYGGSSNLL